MKQYPSLNNEHKIRLFDDCRKAVDTDDYMYIVIWGPRRCSKTTLAGWILYSLYRDWDKVIDAFIFNLPGLIYKLRAGVPQRWPTITKPTHFRVPALNFDDFGVTGNKANIKDDPAWNEFKGGSDAIGTKLGILVLTMIDPTEATSQLIKYTHEVCILERGHYKYDSVTWKQNWYGMNPIPKKTPIEENYYEQWPEWVYKKYDVLRQGLADEVFQRIEDKITINSIDYTLKLLKQTDVIALRVLNQKGQMQSKQVKARVEELTGEQDDDTCMRLRSRSLIIPVSHSKNYYKYEITPLGKEILNVLNDKPLDELQKKLNRR